MSEVLATGAPVRDQFGNAGLGEKQTCSPYSQTQQSPAQSGPGCRRSSVVQAMEECQLAAAEDLAPLLFYLCMDYAETCQR